MELNAIIKANAITIYGYLFMANHNISKENLKKIRYN